MAARLPKVRRRFPVAFFNCPISLKRGIFGNICFLFVINKHGFLGKIFLIRKC